MQSELFNCIVCTFEFDRDDHVPKMLGSCGHTVCSECLDHLLKTRNPVCPLDRITIPETPQKSSEGYPTNIILLQLIEEKQKKGYDICLNHREPNTLVCLTHKCRICHYCANYGEHMNHPTKTIEVIQSEANNKRDRIEAQIRHFDALPKLTEKLIEETRNPLLAATREQFNKIREALTKKKEEIKAEIGLFYAQEVNKVDYKVEKAMTTGEDPFNLGENRRFNKDDENKAVLSVIQAQDAKFDTNLKNLYSSFFSLVQNFRPIVPEQSLKAENGEELYNKCAKVKNVLRLEEYNNILVITPREEVKEREYSEVTDIHYSKSRKVVFDFTRTKPSEQILQAIHYIWDQLGEVYSLKVDLSNSGITEQEVMAFYFKSFWAAPWLQEFNIDLEGCNLGSDALIKMMGQTAMRTPGLKCLSLNFSKTRINDKSVKAFITAIVPLIANFTSFKLNLTKTQISDGMLTDLCESLKGVVRNLTCFDLDLSETESTDSLVKAFTKHTLPTFTALEYFALSLHLTKATDKSIKPLCISMKGVMDKVKDFSFGLSTGLITDSSIQAFAEQTLPSMTQLSDKFIMNVNGKDITSNGVTALFNRMHGLMTNVKIFDLQLWHTQAGDSIFRAFEEKVIPSLVSVTSFKLSLRATQVSDEGIHHLFRNLKKIGKNLKNLGLDISRINISDRPIEILTKRLIPTLGGLESFELNVAVTSLTDASVVPLCTAMKWWVKHLKLFGITLNGTKISDASVNAIMDYVQVVKPALREMNVRLENTKVSDIHKENLYKLKQEIANKI